jgi:ribosomal protein L11 methyltransferase
VGGDRRVIRLAVRVDVTHAEIVLAELAALVPGGFEEVDHGDAVEYVLYGAAGELPDLGDVRAVAGDALVEVSTSEVDDVDWRSFHVPIDVGPLRVRPPWHPPREGALDVVIDPGQAFGTGSHATTRLTLELLTRLEPGGSLADWGCGSGVLAIAAAKLGWSPVLACDIEIESVAAAREGAAANGVTIEVDRCDVRRGGPPAPTVLANLVRPLLLQVAALDELPERLIVSGVEWFEIDEVVGAFTARGLVESDRREGDGWAAIEFIHSAP